MDSERAFSTVLEVKMADSSSLSCSPMVSVTALIVSERTCVRTQ